MINYTEIVIAKVQKAKCKSEKATPRSILDDHMASLLLPPPSSVLSPLMLTVAIMAHFSRRRQQMTIASCQIQKGEQKTKKEAPR